jgi:general secretion pathway protein G
MNLRLLVVALLFGFATIACAKEKVRVTPNDVHAIRSDIQSITTHLKMYESLNGFFPSQQQGLQALVSEPTSSPKPARWSALLKEIPKDPWGTEYVYKATGTSCEVFSAGPDKVPNNEDDVRKDTTVFR